jgi:hypothetical protein
MSLWFMGAIGALAYMAFLMENTDLNLKPFASTIDAKLAANQKSHKTEKLLTDIRDGIGQTNHSLKQLNLKYYGLDNQVANLRKDVEVLAQNNSKLTQKVRRIETVTLPKTSQKQLDKIDITGSLIPLNKTKSIANKKTAAKAKKKLDTKKSNITKPILKLNPKTLGKAEKQQITQTQFAVSLGNFQNIKQLKRAWAKLNKKYNSALSSLKPRYITIVVNNQPKYKLVSGPLKNALDAAKICFHLQQAKTYCKQTIYQGSDI